MEQARLRQEQLDRATAHLDPPFAVVDLDAFDANADDLVRRAADTPIRVASKSVRCRDLTARALAVEGVAGVLAYSVAEAVWLADLGVTDLLVAYPSVDRVALSGLVASETRASVITLMIDDPAQLDLVESTTNHPHPPVRVCLDVDASLRMLGMHLGVRRSPLRTPEQAAALAREVVRRPDFELVGMMFYEAQIAGLPDVSPAVRAVKRRSARDLAHRRRAVVDAVRAVTPVHLVNGGGTGSIETTSADPTVTEVAAGSGLFGPALFDHYRAFTPAPAAMFALPVTRRPGPRVATLFGGGYVASGPATRTRLPLPTWPAGLVLSRAEGAGEVQTPVRGATADGLTVGDRVWLRHAKAGEMCERFDELHLVRGDRVEHTVPTYRGEGKNFG